MVARRAQTPITIRSDRAARRLAELTRRTGRSQAEVIEDALDHVADAGGSGYPAAGSPDPYAPENLAGEDAKQYARIMALVATMPPGSLLSMKEFDALEYDEFGDPR